LGEEKFGRFLAQTELVDLSPQKVLEIGMAQLKAEQQAFADAAKKIDEAFAANPNINLVVLGDLNDYKNSDPIKAVIGRGKHKLVDTRPAERNGDKPVNRSRVDPPTVTWTHYYATEDVYSRLDYILLSPGMAREWVTNESYVLALPDWGKGSDHRPVVATFEAEEK